MAIFFNMGRSSAVSVYEALADGKASWRAAARRWTHASLGVKAPSEQLMAEPTLNIRRASSADIAAILRLYAGDELHGAAVSTEPAESHRRAFAAIEAEPNNGLYLALLGERAVGVFQLTFIPQLSYGGCLVAQLESVHVAPDARSQGVGSQMMSWAINEARRRGCLRIQLTTNVARDRAHSFYERLGFIATHKGMKLYLND
jgi:GNAT superfamily N-acetyltransferase